MENAGQRKVIETEGSPIDVRGLLPPRSEYQVMEMDEQYRLYVINEFYSEYPDPFPEIHLTFDSLRVTQLVNRSVRNQIQNAYYVPPSDNPETKIPQISGFTRYTLDEFTRFQTIRDTFIELIQLFGVSKNENNYTINVRTPIDAIHRNVTGESILMIDGVLVSSKEMLDLSPFLVCRHRCAQ